MILQLLFWLSLFFLLHTYIFYPLLIRILATGKSGNQKHYINNGSLPEITILMSVHNEEDVLNEKLESVFTSNYPPGKIKMIVGSDASTDRTNEILSSYATKDSNLEFHIFDQRKGKANVINELVEETKTDIVVLTDANVIFEESTLYELVKHFNNPEIGLVDSNMINRGFKKDGISIQEKVYISLEVKIKHYEGLVWGTMMGPFGGCYAIRRELYSKVPDTFLVDDFYICMKILGQGKLAINDLDARVHEDVSNNLMDEFKRKVRISTGNFQNFFAFIGILSNPLSGRAFSFFSHKILRWLGPFLFISIFLSNTFLINRSEFFRYTFLVQCVFLILPILDFILRKIRIHVLFLRFATHFLAMNLALIFGFFRFLSGVKTNAWQPTRRHQAE